MVSRARPIALPDGDVRWYDMARNSYQAKVEDLELLSSIEDIDLDDLLDVGLTQGEVVDRIREALGLAPIPPEVEARRNAAREARQVRPACRRCGKEGDSTKHHFVNRWIMRELHDYPLLAARTRCTVPICSECHIDIHDRSTPVVSIVKYLTSEERRFARELIEQLRKERPSLFDLLLKGDGGVVYEARLIQDWDAGLMDH